MPDDEELSPEEKSGEESSLDDLKIKITPPADYEPPPPPRPPWRFPEIHLPRLHLDLPRLESRLLETGAVIGILLVAVFLLYGHRWIFGESIFRGVVQEQYYFLGQYAFDKEIVSDFKKGFFPLWNSLNALGTPLLGNMLSAVFYPLKALIYIHPSLVMRDLYIVLRLLLAGLFAYALARKLRLSFLSAAVCALAFALSGYFKLFVNENYLNADALLPGLCLFTLRLRDRPRFGDAVFLSLLVFAVLNNGHPEAAFYTLLLPAFLVVVTAKSPREFARTALIVGAAAAAGALLSLPMLFPFLEYWARGYHFHVPGAGFFHYSAPQAAAALSPWFYGPAPAGAPFLAPPAIVWPAEVHGIPPYASTVVPWLAPGFGLVPVFLALLAAAQMKRLRRAEVALLLYAVFFSGVIFGLPLFDALGLLPVFSFSGNFKHPVPGIALAVAVLAGRGLELTLAGKLSWGRVLTVLWVLLISIVGLAIASAPLPSGAPFFNKYSGAGAGLVFATGVLLILFSYFQHRPAKPPSVLVGPRAKAGRPPAAPKAAPPVPAKPTLARTLSGVAVLAAVMIGLCLDGYQQPMRDPRYEDRLAAGAALNRLQELLPLDRVYISQDLAPPNLNILLDLADLRVMDGVNDRRLVTAINRVNGHNRAQAGTYWYRETGYLQPRPDRLNHPLLRLFNVRYALMDGPLPYNRTLETILREAQVFAPGPEYFGRARFPFDHGAAPGLLTHAPAQVLWQPTWGNENGEDAPRISVRFRPALTAAAATRERDGVWLMLAAGPELSYCRFLFPRLSPADAQVPIQQLDLDCAAAAEPCQNLIFFSLPVSSSDYDQAGWSDLRAGDTAAFNPGSWEELVRSETWLYQDPEALPRAFLAKTAELASEDRALERLAGGQEDPRDKVFISGRKTLPPLPESEGQGQPGLIRAVDYSPQWVRLGVDMTRSGWLVLSDLAYPGWVAQVDGQPVRLERGDFCLRALPLTPGQHRVNMFYQPASFRLGLWIAIVSLLAIPVLIFYHGFFLVAATAPEEANL